MWIPRHSYERYAFPVLSYSLTVWVKRNNSNRLSPCMPCPIFHPSSHGGIRWLTRGAGRVSNDGALLRIPIRRYISMWPPMWRTERLCMYHPSPQFLYHCGAWGSCLGSSAKTWMCIVPASAFIPALRSGAWDAILACLNTVAHLVTLEEDSALSRDPNMSSLFPPSGNWGYIRNQDVLFSTVQLGKYHKSAFLLCS